MITQKIKEYSKDNLAIREIIITFLGIPIYKYIKTSTNKIAVAQLSQNPKINKHNIGFSYETKYQSKKNK